MAITLSSGPVFLFFMAITLAVRVCRSISGLWRSVGTCNRNVWNPSRGAVFSDKESKESVKILEIRVELESIVCRGGSFDAANNSREFVWADNFIFHFRHSHARRVFVGWKASHQTNKEGHALDTFFKNGFLFPFPLRFHFIFFDPGNGGHTAAGNFDSYLSFNVSTSYCEASERKCNQYCNWIYIEPLESSDRIYTPVIWLGLSRCQMKSFSTWHWEISKRCKLIKWKLATWNYDLSTFVALFSKFIRWFATQNNDCRNTIKSHAFYS